MFRTFKKSIAILLAFTFILSLVPVSSFAEDSGETVEAIIKFTKPAYSRSKKEHQAIKTYPAGKEANNYIQYSYRNGSVAETTSVTIDNEYYAYTQLDLTGYEEIIANESTEFVLDLRAYGTGSYSMQDFRVYGIQEAIEDYDDATITYASAKKQGLHNLDVRGTLIASDADTTKKGGWQGPIDVASLKSVLNQGYDDSVVTVVFATISTATASRLYYNNANCGLHIKYNPADINNQDYVESRLENINTWKDLTGEDGVTETGLPKKYYGMDITWVSSDPDYISNDGVVTQRPEAKDVTLTGTFTYKGAYEGAAEATMTKEFTVTVEAETPVEVMIPFTNYAYSRSSATGTTNAKNIAYEVLSAEGVTARSIITGGSYEGYTQLDLKGYEEILKNPHTSVQMSLTAGYRYSGSRIYNVSGVLAPDKADSYNWETVTWNIANGLGLHKADRPVLFVKDDDVRNASGSVVVVDADKEALLSVLDENNTNSVVSMHLVQLPWGGTLASDETPDTTVRCNVATTGLIIKYYESEIDDAAYYADIENTFAWENLTSDEQSVLVNNLPNYYKGADIVWSSAEGAVTSDGALVPSDGVIKADTVTANVTYKDNSFTKEYSVNVCDNKITLGTPALSLENTNALASFDVVNGTANKATYQLYLATYNDGELSKLIPVTMDVEKGSAKTETLNTSVPAGCKVKFFVWKDKNATPLFKALEK